MPPASGGFAPRPPLASGGWGLRPQTPKTAPPIANFWLRAWLQVIITNEIPVTLLQAYIPIPRHFRKSVLIRRIIGSRLCKAVVGQQFSKRSRKLQTRIMFENYYFFFHYCLLSCRYAMLQKSILNKPKWGGTSSR